MKITPNYRANCYELTLAWPIGLLKSAAKSKGAGDLREPKACTGPQSSSVGARRSPTSRKETPCE